MTAFVGHGFVGQGLADFVAGSRWGDLGASLRHAAKRSLLNYFGCAIGSAGLPTIGTLVEVLGPVAGLGRATLVGRAERFDGPNACLVNAAAGNLLDYDDTHLETVIHPTAPVAPALLFLAEERGLAGAEVLHALALGMEVACRLGLAVSPGHYARGWHITATCGVFGAAAGAAKLLGLNGTQTWHALGVAASQAAGVVENLPSAAKNVGVGNAARNGLLAALLAQAGLEAAPAAIEGRLGWARASGDEPRIASIAQDLGGQWEVEQNTFKPYPAGIVFHPVIDACLALRLRGLRPISVRSVLVRGPALLLERGDRPVANEREARVSIHHSAAVALLYGAAGMREFETEAVTKPEVVALRGRVRAALDPALPVGAATVEVETLDGERLSETVTAARGGALKPLSDAEIEAKVRDLATRNPGCDVERVIAEIWRLDTAATLQPLLAAAVPKET